MGDTGARAEFKQGGHHRESVAGSANCDFYTGRIFDADAAGECKRVRVRSGASASRHQEGRELLESGEFGAVA
jgi:hypothetical protein